VQVNIQRLIDDVQCYQTVRELRWPDGVACPSCESKDVIKRGFDDTEPARQRYECHNCNTRFDDLTDTIFAGHHQPLKVWVLCLYFMGLNLWCCPSIACMKALRSSIGRLLIKLIAKVRRHAIAQQLLHRPYVVRYTCCHGRCDRLPPLG